jgi:hypothetical protein
MRKWVVTAAAATVVAFGLAGRASAVDRVFAASGVYDSTSNVNVVEANANGNPITATGPTDLLGFATNVTTAFAQGHGGVIDFDTPLVTVTVPTDTFQFTFAGGTKSVTATPDRNMRTATYGSATAISGANQIDLPDAIENTQTFVLTFGAIVGGEAGEVIRAVGLTANSRNSLTPTVSMSVGYSDGTTSATLSDALLAGAGADDTFYGFVAPDGKGITSLTVTRTLRVPFDDLAFITSSPPAVPEPGTAAVGGIGALALLGRRRVGRRA